MTPKELLKPRIKLIADWPGCEWAVGTIFPDNFADFKKWPHLFQELPWYAERKPEEMPEYVLVIEDGSFDYLDGDIYDENAKDVFIKFPPVGEVIKVSDGYEWGLLNIAAHLLNKQDSRVEIHASLLLPATETEYNNYLKSKQ